METISATDGAYADRASWFEILIGCELEGTLEIDVCTRWRNEDPIEFLVDSLRVKQGLGWDWNSGSALFLSISFPSLTLNFRVAFA